MAHLPRRPKTKRGTLLAIGGVLIVIAAAFALVYFVFFPTSSPRRFAVTSTAGAPVGSGSQLASRWRIASGSAAGYRVREKLAFLPAQSDAVGRTSAITGEATVSDSKGAVTVTSASFTVDVSQLTSDKSMRDRRIHTIGLESDQYPTATFKLSTPLALPASALSGNVVRVSASGIFQHPRHIETGDRSAADAPIQSCDRGRRFDHVPLERIQHDGSKRRGLRERHEQGDHGVRPAPAARVAQAPMGPSCVQGPGPRLK
jgi:polyisoprenoid-binding protein YceI